MTDADVFQLIQKVKSHGVVINDYQACVFLAAREILAKDPGHKVAAEVVKCYSEFFATGVRVESFAEFVLPEESLETDEKKAASAKRAADCVEFYRKATLVGIRNEDYAGSQVFLKSHNLSVDEFLQMSDEQIVGLR